MKKVRLGLVGKIFLIIFVIGIIIGTLTIIWALDPGSNDDPLVSVSYVDKQVIPSMKDYVDNKIAAISASTVPSTSANADAFSVVEVKQGKKLIGSAGCELILRMGKANIIATAKGGLSDTTAGYDLRNGEQCPANHLLIIPLSDGRGLEAITDTLIMVKGKYDIR